MSRIYYLLILFLPILARSQDDSLEIRQVIEQFFDALRIGDTSELKKTIEPHLFLSTSGTARNGDPTFFIEEAEEFIESAGTPRKEEWNEIISELEFHISDHLASVWMNYRFYINDEFSHCGVNCFQLHRSKEGWKIFSISDTRRRTNCFPQN